MYKCEYCDLNFDEKKYLTTHQKTKKCTLHRNIGFFCQKCLTNVKGYDNILKHMSECSNTTDPNYNELTLLTTLLTNLLSTNLIANKFDIEINSNEDEGVIKFKKTFNYIHPIKLEYGINIPQKTYLFQKILTKYSDNQLLGSHHNYLNDIYNKISRVSDGFQFLSVKYTFEDFLTNLWLKSTVQLPFYLNGDIIYILGKVQCQNDNGQKWFGDTFTLKENEKIIKCVWYQDTTLKQFFGCLKPLLKDILNLYLVLGNWVLKQKKIKLYKLNLDEPSNYKIIEDTMNEYGFFNLIENIKKLESYDTFSRIFKNLLYSSCLQSQMYTNIQNIFKDELLPSQFANEEVSLMCMNNPEYTGNNYDYLMDYILPSSEKAIFKSKIN
ncbi:hypothetical protein IIV22_084R [Invertebrate iridescent virus 22]|uniref:C2H2-type domain-containing protein n=1 Tax=Invertebrate iridescent virus 22 TaxID=345198 RepID=S6DAX7_9VIRU|nr:hypothetical protein IIV22_084R [Invertebrate iridescent virus 22]CCV01761.1 hypothetical protein IIV22_084R [Invertebrate iridescent virus 22]